MSQVIPFVEVQLSSNGQVASDIRTFDIGGGARTVTPVLQSFDVQFGARQDHHLGRLHVALSADFQGPTGTTVWVRTDFALRDWSGGDSDLDGDDPIEATITYAVILLP
jgi:hypothetical protein